MSRLRFAFSEQSFFRESKNRNHFVVSYGVFHHTRVDFMVISATTEGSFEALLVIAKGDHGIDARGAARWDVSGDQGDCTQ